MLATRTPFENVAAMLGALCALACGSTDPKPEEPGGENGETSKVYLPLATGNSWTYRVTADGEVTTKVTTVGEEEPVGGSGPNRDVLAFKVTTLRGVAGENETISWQKPLGALIVRYREQAYGATTGMLDLEEHWSPYKLRLDQSEERVADQASFLETYEETKLPVGGEQTTAQRSDRWTVLRASESVTVPAGTFDALVIQRVSSSAGNVKVYWFAEGVGKVKEEGGQLEELESYEVAE